MILVIYFLPLLTCAILSLINGGDFMEWDVYAWILAGSWVYSGVIHYYMIRKRITDEEYLSAWATEIIHEDAWTEIIHVTRTVPAGRDSQGRTIYRTVHETRHVRHPECWSLKDSDGAAKELSGERFLEIRNLWNSPEKEDTIWGSDIVGGRRYLQKHAFSDVLKRFEGSENVYAPPLLDLYVPVTRTQKYVNKVRHSSSIFRLDQVKEKEAKALGLYYYPPVGEDQEPILGRAFPEQTMKKFRLLNALSGWEYQIHLFVLFFDAAKGIPIAEKQRAFWEGGNKNELTVCLGMEADTVQWCRAFSWSDEITLQVKTEAWFRDHPVLDMDAFHRFLLDNLSLWKRKEFKDFNYLHVSLSKKQMIWLSLLTVLLEAGIITYLLLA